MVWCHRWIGSSFKADAGMLHCLVLLLRLSGGHCLKVLWKKADIHRGPFANMSAERTAIGDIAATFPVSVNQISSSHCATAPKAVFDSQAGPNVYKSELQLHLLV